MYIECFTGSIRTKMLFGFSIQIIFIIGIGLFSYVNTASLSKAITFTINKVFAEVATLNELQVQFLEIQQKQIRPYRHRR